MARIGPWMVSVNGVAYEFVTYDLNGPFPNSAGVYMLLKGTHTPQNTINHDILYVGETGSFQTRLRPGHHDWNEASKRGMNYLSVYIPKYGESRTDIQDSLIEYFKPPLNDRIG